jgi:hypothetical protein
VISAWRSPSHVLHQLHNLLNNHFPDVSLAFTFSWYELTWFSLMGMHDRKHLCYGRQDHDDLINNVLETAVNIRSHPRQLVCVIWHHCEACMWAGWDNFEQFLWRSTQTIWESPLHNQTFVFNVMWNSNWKDQITSEFVLLITVINNNK